MKKLLAAALAAVVLSTSATFADARVQVGRLSCDVDGGIGYLIGSSKEKVGSAIQPDYEINKACPGPPSDNGTALRGPARSFGVTIHRHRVTVRADPATR